MKLVTVFTALAFGLAACGAGSNPAPDLGSSTPAQGVVLLQFHDEFDNSGVDCVDLRAESEPAIDVWVRAGLGVGLFAQDGADVVCRPDGCDAPVLHQLVDADGSTLDVPADLSAYELRAGQIDNWGRQDRGQTTLRSGLVFEEFCG